MRLMSFALTRPQIENQSKTVTRRMGWKFLKPGDRIRAVNKCMGFKKGEKPVDLAVIEVVAVHRECLFDGISPADCVREGFPSMKPTEFVEMFCRHMKCQPETFVTRIAFRYVSASPAKAQA